MDKCKHNLEKTESQDQPSGETPERALLPSAAGSRELLRSQSQARVDGRELDTPSSRRISSQSRAAPLPPASNKAAWATTSQGGQRPQGHVRRIQRGSLASPTAEQTPASGPPTPPPLRALPLSGSRYVRRLPPPALTPASPQDTQPQPQPPPRTHNPDPSPAPGPQEQWWRSGTRLKVPTNRKDPGRGPVGSPQTDAELRDSSRSSRLSVIPS